MGRAGQAPNVAELAHPADQKRRQTSPRPGRALRLIEGVDDGVDVVAGKGVPAPRCASRKEKGREAEDTHHFTLGSQRAARAWAANASSRLASAFPASRPASVNL